MTIGDIELVEKKGGRSGHYREEVESDECRESPHLDSAAGQAVADSRRGRGDAARPVSPHRVHSRHLGRRTRPRSGRLRRRLHLDPEGGRVRARRRSCGGFTPRPSPSRRCACPSCSRAASSSATRAASRRCRSPSTPWPWCSPWRSSCRSCSTTSDRRTGRRTTSWASDCRGCCRAARSGLIGVGTIGSEIAARARAFGMRVVALRRRGGHGGVAGRRPGATVPDQLDGVPGADRRAGDRRAADAADARPDRRGADCARCRRAPWSSTSAARRSSTPTR